MLKRILIIAFFTGAGQVFVVFALKYISHHSSPEQMKAIAQVDSLLLFMMNAIALGLQPAAMRNLALADEWRHEYHAAQSARLTLGILIAVLAMLALADAFYLAFLLAPALALSGDYALYARGFPVRGAIIAFTRSFVPFLLLILFTSLFPEWLPWIYLVALAFTYVITNLFITFFLKVPFFFSVQLKSLQLYLGTLPLGFVSLGLYFIGMGVVLIAPYFYPAPVVATAFVGLKFYIIFKGALRIIQQAFLKEMIRNEVGLKVDKLSTLLGLTFFSFMICFPAKFINLFFGEKYLAEKNYFILLGAAALVYSLFSSFTTKAMLEKKDKHYSITTLAAALFTLFVTVILSYFWQTPFSIGISILAGEIFFAAGMLLLMKNKNLLWERLLFLVKNLAFFLIPFGAMFLHGHKTILFYTTLLLFVLALFSWYKNKFSFPEPDDSTGETRKV